MGGSEKNTEYKISRLGSSDRGIRITGTTREVDLEKTKSLLDKNFRRLIVETRIEGLKSKKKYRKAKGKKWDKEVRIVSYMEDLKYMEKLLNEELKLVRVSDIYQLRHHKDVFVRYFKLRDK